MPSNYNSAILISGSGRFLRPISYHIFIFRGHLGEENYTRSIKISEHSIFFVYVCVWEGGVCVSHSHHFPSGAATDFSVKTIAKMIILSVEFFQLSVCPSYSSIRVVLKRRQHVAKETTVGLNKKSSSKKLSVSTTSNR